MGLSNAFHTSMFGDVLPNKAIGVFVRATFPGMIGSREVAGNRESGLYLLIGMKFGTVVEGDGEEALPVLGDGLDTGLGDFKSSSGAYFLDDDEAGSTFDESNDTVMAVRANDRVGFPMTDLEARFDLVGAFRDRTFTREDASRVV